MKKLLIIIALLWGSIPALACKCKFYKHFIETSENAEYIVVGKLLDIIEADTLSNTIVGLKAKFEITQNLKGQTKTSIIEIIGGYGQECLFNLNELNNNKTYVIQLRKDFKLSRCGYTILEVEGEQVKGIITKAETQIMDLSELAKEIKNKKR